MCLVCGIFVLGVFDYDQAFSASYYGCNSGGKLDNEVVCVKFVALVFIQLLPAPWLVCCSCEVVIMVLLYLIVQVPSCGW